VLKICYAYFGHTEARRGKLIPKTRNCRKSYVSSRLPIFLQVASFDFISERALKE